MASDETPTSELPRAVARALTLASWTSDNPGWLQELVDSVRHVLPARPVNPPGTILINREDGEL